MMQNINWILFYFNLRVGDDKLPKRIRNQNKYKQKRLNDEDNMEVDSKVLKCEEA